MQTEEKKLTPGDTPRVFFRPKTPKKRVFLPKKSRKNYGKPGGGVKIPPLPKILLKHAMTPFLAWK